MGKVNMIRTAYPKKPILTFNAWIKYINKQVRNSK